MTDASRFGYTIDEWNRAVDSGVDILKGVARDRTAMAYGDLCNRVFDATGVEIVPGEYALRAFVGAISKSTLESDDIAITTLVTYAHTTESGGGLYTLAKAEGLLPKSATEAHKDAFRIEHMNLADARWQRVHRPPGERYRDVH